MLYPLSYGRGCFCQKGMQRARVTLFIQVFMPGRQLGSERNAAVFSSVSPYMLRPFLLTATINMAEARNSV